MNNACNKDQDAPLFRVQETHFRRPHRRVWRRHTQ